MTMGGQNKMSNFEHLRLSTHATAYLNGASCEVALRMRMSTRKEEHLVYDFDKEGNKEK
jgi:hypothetical protein